MKRESEKLTFPMWKQQIAEKRPLLHCLTNHITILDCANMAGAIGARPIMAEHPEEVDEITAVSDALVCNIGNITDIRMRAMLIAGNRAKQSRIPSILDLVGVGASQLRLNFAKKFTQEVQPTVLKGNMSEMLAFAGEVSHAVGVDAGCEDALEKGKLNAAKELAMYIADLYGSLVVITGIHDIVADAFSGYTVSNGCEKMGRISGSGCMLNMVLAAFSSIGKEERVKCLSYGAAMFGICGEMAFANHGVGSGRIRLFDMAEQICDSGIQRAIKVEAWVR